MLSRFHEDDKFPPKALRSEWGTVIICIYRVKLGTWHQNLKLDGARVVIQWYEKCTFKKNKLPCI